MSTRSAASLLLALVLAPCAARAQSEKQLGALLTATGAALLTAGASLVAVGAYHASTPAGLEVSIRPLPRLGTERGAGWDGAVATITGRF